MSSSNRHRIVVFGHSYVRRAQAAAPSNLGLHDCSVAFISRGGGSVVFSRDTHCLYNYLPQVEDFRPNVIFVHAGEVDLHLPRHRLLTALEQFFDTIIGHCQPAIFIISQLLLFPELEQLREKVTWINLRLQQYVHRRNVGNNVARRTRLAFWRHRCGLWGPNSHRLFSSDRTHVNATGMHRYVCSIRTAVGQQIHSA